MAEPDQRVARHMITWKSILTSPSTFFLAPQIPSTRTTRQMQPTQSFRCRTSGKVANVQTLVDPKTKERIVLWRDIQRAFKNAASIWEGNNILSFLTDENLEEIIPLRIAYHPDNVLEVDMEDTNQVRPDGESSTATHVVALPVNAVGVLAVNQDSIEYSKAMAHLQSNPALRGPMSGQTDIAPGLIAIIQYVYGRIEQVQGQLVQMHQRMDANQQQLLENDQEILRMLQRTLDRLTVIQKSIQALATQTYELHEYPIPRLFIVLPKALDLSGKIKGILSDQFRLYFLCECGKHTMSEDTEIPHEIHLAKHEGYDLEKPTVFFERFGSYVLTVLHMIKYGITVANLIVPPLATSKIVEGIDTAQKHLEHLKKNIVPLIDSTIEFLDDTKFNNETGDELSTDHTEFDQLEALEGVDLRHLESYLKVKDKGRVLGNLYRIVTPEGHVKWVCFDHFRASYGEVAIKQLQEIVTVNRGTYVKETGSIEIKLETSTQAKQFYEAMEKARCILELDITFGWDATKDDLRQFAKVVTKANVVNLTIHGTYLKSPALNIVYRTRRFDPIMLLTSNARLQSLQIKGFDDFFARVSKSSVMPSPKLRILSVESELPLHFKVKTINDLFKYFSGLTTLEVRLNHRSSITKVVLDIIEGLQKLELLKIDCKTLSVTAAIVKGNVQSMILVADRIDSLVPSDLEAIHEDCFSKLLIKFSRQVEDVKRLPDALWTAEFSHVQTKDKEGKSSTILAAREWKLQNLVDMATSETHKESETFLIDCPRLSLTGFSQGKRQGMGMTIERFGRLTSDDLAFIQQGHLIGLVIGEAIKDEDKARLTDTLSHNKRLDHLIINGKEQSPTTGGAPEMKLLELVAVVMSNASNNLKSFSIGYQRLSLAANVVDGKMKDCVLTAKSLSDIRPDELAVTEHGHLTRLELGNTPRSTDMIKIQRILQAKVANFHLQIGQKKEHPPSNTGYLRLWEIVKIATSSALCNIELLKIDYWKLSVTTGIKQGKIQNTTLSVDNPDDLVPEDFDGIQWNTFTWLRIRYPWRGNHLKPHITARFSRIQTNFSRERFLLILAGPNWKLQNLMVLATFTTFIPPEERESFSIDCPRYSLKVSEGKDRDIAMTIERLEHLKADDIKYIQQHLCRLRLVIRHAPKSKDKDRLIEVLQSLTHLDIKYGKEQDPAIAGVKTMKFHDLATIATPNTPSTLTSFSINYQRLSLTMSYSHGSILKDVSMTIKQLNDLEPNEFAYIQQGHLTRLVIREAIKHEDKALLINVLCHNERLNHLEIIKEKEHSPTIGGAPEMTLPVLVAIVTSNVSNNLKSFSIDYQRLSLAANVVDGKMKDCVMTTTSLSDIYPDEFAVIERGYLTRLELSNTPQSTDMIQIQRILQAKVANFHLQIGQKKGHPPSGTGHPKLWEILRMAVSSTLCKIESLRIDYWKLSVTISIKQGKIQNTTLSVDNPDDLTPEDFDNIQWNTFTWLMIKYPLRGNHLKPHITARFSRIQTNFSRERYSIILAEHDRKLRDLIAMATSNTSILPHEERESFSIDCPRYSLKVSEGKDRDIAMTIERLEHLNPDDVTYIQQGHRLIRLTIRQAPKYNDKYRLIEVLQSLTHLDIQYGKQQDPAIADAETMNFHDLATVVTSNTPSTLMSFSIDHQRLYLTMRCSHSYFKDVSMTIKRLNDLEPDELAYIQQGHLTRLVIKDVIRDEDKARLINVLCHNKRLDHLEIINGKGHSSTEGASEIELLDLVALVTLSTSNKLKSLSIGYQRLSLTANVAVGNIKDYVMTAKSLSDIYTDDLAVMEHGYLTRLELGDTPQTSDMIQIHRILNAKVANFHLQIGHKKESPPSTTGHLMLWDIVKMATSSTLCRIESLRIDYWKLSVITGVSQGKVRNPILTTDFLSDVVHYDLDAIQWDTFSELSIKYTPQEGDDDRLKTTITTNFSGIQFKHRGDQGLVILSARDRKLQELVDVVTSEPPEGLELYPIMLAALFDS
ncbi:MAG: hypothetical protein J3Q66DRAFT_366771 [Benniella sp.]|nr:MAG: hypothetical protein J3Q66DRAFT_366771 [Benniella sp.]